MTRALLHESSTLGEKTGNRWKATLITPGKGSSGTYSESVLMEYAASAFPAGTKLWFKHPGEGGPGDRDPRDQWGYLDEDATFEPGVGITGVINVLEHARPIVESIGTQAALSIWAMGEADDQGNVTALYPHETNSVDMVGYPGRPGSGLTQKMLESFRLAAEQSLTPTSAQETQKKKEHMEKQEIKELFESILDAKLAPIVTFVTESLDSIKAKAKAEVQVEADDAAVKTALESYDEKIAAIEAADFPKEVAESLRAAAKAGQDVAPLIESTKKLGEAFKAQAEEKDEVVYGGRISESAVVDAKDLIPVGW